MTPAGGSPGSAAPSWARYGTMSSAPPSSGGRGEMPDARKPDESGIIDEHDPEKWAPVFGRDHATNGLERDADAKQRHPAPGASRRRRGAPTMAELWMSPH